MSYNEEMLRLYFKEMSYTKKQINELLETNPFDDNFSFWEKNKKKENKSFAYELKKNHLININQKIQEVVIHPNNSVCKHLENNSILLEYSINNNLQNLQIRNNNLILIKDIYPTEKAFIKKIHDTTPFIIGTCTSNYDYYKFALSYYKSILTYLKELNKKNQFELKNYFINEKKIVYLRTKK